MQVLQNAKSPDNQFGLTVLILEIELNCISKATGMLQIIKG